MHKGTTYGLRYGPQLCKYFIGMVDFVVGQNQPSKMWLWWLMFIDFVLSNEIKTDTVPFILGWVLVDGGALNEMSPSCNLCLSCLVRHDWIAASPVSRLGLFKQFPEDHLRNAREYWIETINWIFLSLNFGHAMHQGLPPYIRIGNGLSSAITGLPWYDYFAYTPLNSYI